MSASRRLGAFEIEGGNSVDYGGTMRSIDFVNPVTKYTEAPSGPSTGIGNARGSRMLQSHDNDGGGIFEEDPQSLSLFDSISNQRVKQKIKAMIQQLHNRTTNMQNDMKGEMTYSEIMESGILYPGEILTGELDPMQLKMLKVRYNKETAELLDNSDARRYTLRIYLTNTRLIFVDAEPDRGGHMKELPGKRSFLIRKYYELSYEMESELWYFPVSLADLTGLSLDVRSVSRTAQSLKYQRPLWGLLLTFLGIVVACWAQFEMWLAPLLIIGHDKPAAGTRIVLVLATVSAGALFTAGTYAWIFYNYLLQGKYKYTGSQQRVMHLGILDPITKTSTVFECHLASDYSIENARHFIRYLQQSAPKLHHGTLAAGIVAEELEIRSRQRDATTETSRDVPAATVKNTPADPRNSKGKTIATAMKRSRKPAKVVAPVQRDAPIEVKLVFGSPVDCVLKVVLDANANLRNNTARALDVASARGIADKAAVLRFAARDRDGDMCVIGSDEQMKAHLKQPAVDGGGRLYAFYATKKYSL
eukprot:SAG22_NODE_475_length_10003_cov_3.943356_9_plen_532_part_00